MSLILKKKNKSRGSVLEFVAQFTKVGDVEECVEDGEEEDGPAGHLVEVDVLVAGEEVAGGGVPEAGHHPPQDQQQQQRAVQVQALTCGTHGTLQAYCTHSASHVYMKNKPL